MDKELQLSNRQQAILQLAAQGLTDVAIANELGISEGTLRTHWDRIRIKTDARSRCEAVARVGRSILQSTAFERDTYRALLDDLPLLAWSTLASGEVDYINRHFLVFSGLSAQEVYGQGCRALMKPQDLKASAVRWQVAVEACQAYNALVALRSGADGEFYLCELHLRPLNTGDQRPLRWIGWALPLVA